MCQVTIRPPYHHDRPGAPASTARGWRWEAGAAQAGYCHQSQRNCQVVQCQVWLRLHQQKWHKRRRVRSPDSHHQEQSQEGRQICRRWRGNFHDFFHDCILFVSSVPSVTRPLHWKNKLSGCWVWRRHRGERQRGLQRVRTRGRPGQRKSVCGRPQERILQKVRL